MLRFKIDPTLETAFAAFTTGDDTVLVVSPTAFTLPEWLWHELADRAVLASRLEADEREDDLLTTEDIGNVFIVWDADGIPVAVGINPPKGE